MDDRWTRRVHEATARRTEGQGVQIAVKGAEIVRIYEGPYTNQVTYRQRCDSCGYVPPNPPITVSILPYGNVAYGAYHAASFVCSFCGHRQTVEIQG
jgi:hypothetical protein